ncbi:hypothetical protein RhiirA4_486136 [Rhizophagus irregularis]|uniref:Uncharacterized protein n=1 Tax=Rhizophagus irregularis TaxID=588596 RepID=A0A2I1HR06_9GLOM|nr:hypothetical protein RhiirA4_486136 [Rhizophagus irregularis]
MKYLQENRFVKKEGSIALIAQQVQEILADEFLNSNTYESLLYHKLNIFNQYRIDIIKFILTVSFRYHFDIISI